MNYLCIIVGVIGVLIGIGFFFYSLHLRDRKKNQLSFSRSQAWYLYKKAKRLLATIRSADKLYNESNKNALVPEIIKKLAKSEALGVEILDETIRHIQFFEPNFNSETIQQWENENKIIDDKYYFDIKEDDHLFEKLVIDNKIDES